MIGKDQDPNIGKDTQFSEDNQPANKGRKPSLKKQLAKVGLSDGWITFKAKDIQILENGDVKVRVPKEEALALNLFKIAMGKNSSALQAIKTYLEAFDGKATQEIDHTTKGDKIKTQPTVVIAIESIYEDESEDSDPED